jgi:hypothetical protein
MNYSSTSRKRSTNKSRISPKSSVSRSAAIPSAHNIRRDEDEENLQAALAASMQ